ncbi:MAG: AI-2E family transporter [Pseudomonadales bacterium]|nr:AI-2E family transporter [Pseudomonadales bacterium]
MSAQENPSQTFTKHAIEACIRIGLIFMLVAWCFDIVKPFILPIVWAMIIAVATYPLFLRWRAFLGERNKLAAITLTLFALSLIVVPAVILSTGLYESAQILAINLEKGNLDIPDPNNSVKEWPLVGEKLYAFWAQAANNIEGTLKQLAPQLKTFGQWLFGRLGSVGGGMLQFIIALIIAGVLLTGADKGKVFGHRIATGLAGNAGKDYLLLAGNIVQSVTQGILGVALIQGILAGIGFTVMDVPGASLLAFLVLFLSVIQVGPTLILLPVGIYMLGETSTVTGVLFLIWCIAVGLIDNILKPILLSRGVDVPMSVVFIGAIGGFISMGIIGLFVGAVILTLSYSLFDAWLKSSEVNE